MALRHIRAFGSDFSIEVKRSEKAGWLSVTVSGDGFGKTYSVRQGQSVDVKLK